MKKRKNLSKSQVKVLEKRKNGGKSNERLRPLSVYMEDLDRHTKLVWKALRAMCPQRFFVGVFAKFTY